MTINRLLPLLGLCTTLAFAALPARASLVIGNLDNTPVLPDGVALYTTIPGAVDYAFGFLMPSGTSYSLDSLILTLGVDAGDPADIPGAPVVTAALYGDASGVPGGLLASFTQPTIPAAIGAADYTLTPITPFDLQAGSTYWLTVSGDFGGPALAELFWEVRNNQVPSGIATSQGYLIDAGGGWGPWTASSPALQINGTPVPVPAPLALMLAGLAGIGAVRLRRKGKGFTLNRKALDGTDRAHRLR